MKNSFKKNFIFIIDIIRKLIYDDIFALSAQLAYPLIMSVVPMLMFVLALAGSYEGLIAEMFNALQFILPKMAFDIVKKILEETLYASSFSYAVLFSAVYFISVGVRGVMKVLNKAYHQTETRSIFMIFFLSFVFAILLGIGIYLSFIVLVLGELILKAIFGLLKLHIELAFMFQAIRFLCAYVILGIIISLTYMFTPNLKLKFKDVYKGAYFSSACLIIVSLAFGFYMNHFSKYSLLFGSLGGLFMFFVWIYMSSFVILLGGEINAFIYENKRNIIQ